MALLYVKKPYVYNAARIRPADVYARPALSPFYNGMFGPGYTQQNLNKQFEYTIKQMAVSPVAVNSRSYIERVREMYGYTDTGAYDALGTVGGLVGVGVGAMIGSGAVTIKNPIKSLKFWKEPVLQKPLTFNFVNPISKRGAFIKNKILKDDVKKFVSQVGDDINKGISDLVKREGKNITADKIQKVINDVTASAKQTKINGVEPDDLNKAVDIIKKRADEAVASSVTNTVKKIDAVVARIMDTDAIKAEIKEAVDKAVNEAVKAITKQDIDDYIKTASKGIKSKKKLAAIAEDAAANVAAKVTKEVSEKVTKEITEEITERVAKEAGEEVAEETAKAVAKTGGKAAGLIPKAGLLVSVPMLGLSITGLGQSIADGDAEGVLFNSLLTVLDAADVAGDAIGGGVGDIISLVAGLASMGIGAIQGWRVGQTAGRSLSPEGRKVQELFLQNLYASTLSRPISTIGTILTMIAVPALLSASSYGLSAGAGLALKNKKMGLAKFLKVLDFVPSILTNTAVGNQVRAGVSMLTVQAVNEGTSKLDDMLPWAPENPEDVNFVSAVSLYGDINDNLYGATRNKAILLGLASGDPSAQRKALARAWGNTDDLSYALTFDDVRQAAKLDTGVPALNAIISTIGEILIDPQNMYEVAQASSDKKLIKTGTETLHKVIKQKRAQFLLGEDVGEFKPLFEDGGILNTKTDMQAIILERLFTSYIHGDDVNATAATLLGTKHKGTNVTSTTHNFGEQINTLKNVFGYLINGDMDKYIDTVSAGKIREALDKVNTLKSKTDAATEVERKAVADAMNTYLRLVNIYGGESVDILTENLLKDFNLVISNKHIKDLYISYNGFKAHMDMVSDLAGFILKASNPMGALVQAGLNKGVSAGMNLLRNIGAPKEQRQKITISIEDSIKDIEQAMEITRNKIIELKKQRSAASLSFVERLKQEQKDDTETKDRVIGAIDRIQDNADVVNINNKIDAYNAELDLLNQAKTDIEALREQFEKEQENYASIDYLYNGETIKMDKTNEAKFKAKIDDFESKHTPEDIEKARKSYIKPQEYKDYFKMKNLYNAHQMRMLMTNKVLRTAVVAAESAINMLAEIHLLTEETKVEILASMQYIQQISNTFKKQLKTDVLDDSISRYKKKLKNSVDEQEKILLQKRIDELTAERKKYISAEDKQKIIDDINKNNVGKNKVSKKELAKKLAAANAIKVSTETVILREFDPDAHNENVKDLKSAERILHENNLTVHAKDENGKTVTLQDINFDKDLSNFTLFEITRTKTTDEIINGLIANLLGDKYPEDFLKYSGITFGRSKEEWDAMSENSRLEYTVNYIMQLSKDTLDADDVYKLCNSKEFKALFARINAEILNENTNTIHLEAMTEIELQEYVIDSLFKRTGGDIIKKFLEEKLKAFAKLNDVVEKIYNKNHFTDDQIAVVEDFLKRFNETLIHNRMFKYVNIYFNNNVKIDKTSLSLFAKENEVRSRVLDLTKYDKIKTPFEYRELLKDIYEEDDNLINVLFEDKKLDEELKFVKGKDTPTPKLSTPINNMRDLTIEELEKLVVTDAQDKVLVDEYISKRKSNEKDERVKHRTEFVTRLKKKANADDVAKASVQAINKAIDEELKEIKSINLLSDAVFKNLKGGTNNLFSDTTNYFELLENVLLKNNALNVTYIVYEFSQQNFISEDAVSVTDAKNLSKILKEYGVNSNAFKQAVTKMAQNILILTKTNPIYKINFDKLVALKPGENENDDATIVRRIVDTYLGADENFKVEVRVNKSFKSVLNEEVNVTRRQYNKLFKGFLEEEVINYYLKNNIVLTDTNGKVVDYYDVDFYLKDFARRSRGFTASEIKTILTTVKTRTDDALTNVHSITGQKSIKQAYDNVNKIEREIVRGLGSHYYTGAEDIVKRAIFTNPRFIQYLQDVLSVKKGGGTYNTETFALLEKVQDLLVEEYSNKAEFNPEGYTKYEYDKDRNEYFFTTKNGNKLYLIELMLRFRINSSNFLELVRNTNKAMADKGGVSVEDLTYTQSGMIDAFNNLYNTFGNLFSFNTFNMSKEAFDKLDVNKGRAQKDIDEDYALLSDPNTTNVFNMLTFNPRTGTKFEYYEPLTRIYRKLNASQNNDGDYVMRGTYKNNNYKKTIPVQDINTAFVFAIITDNKLSDDAKKKMLLDVFFYDLKYVKGIFDGETIDELKAKLKTAEARNTKDPIGLLLKKIDIKRYTEQIKRAEEETVKFDNAKANTKVKENIYDEIFNKGKIDFDFITEIFNNKLSKEDSSIVVAFDKATNKNVVVKKYIYDEHGNAVLNVVDKSKGLAGFNARILGLLYDFNPALLTPAQTKKDSIDTLVKSYIEDGTIVARRNNSILIVCNDPKKVSQYNLLREDLKVNGISDLFIVSKQQYEDIKAMLVDDTKYTDTPSYETLPTTKPLNNIINRASKDTLIGAMINDIQIIEGNKGTTIEKLIAYKKLVDEGKFKIPAGATKGVSFFNSTIFKRLEKSAELHTAFQTFINGFDDEFLLSFNMEKIAKLYFNNYWLRDAEDKDITEENIKGLQEIDQTMYAEFDTVKINNVRLIELIIKAINETRKQYKNNNTIDFDYNKILSKELIDDMFAIENSLNNIINILIKSNKDIQRKLSIINKKKNDEIKVSTLYDEELQRFFKPNLALMTDAHGQSVTTKNGSKNLISVVKDIKAKYDENTKTMINENDSRVKHYNKIRRAEYNKINNITEGSGFQQNFIKNLFYNKEIDVEVLKRAIPPEVVTKVYASYKTKEEADAVLKRLFTLYNNNINNAGYFNYINKNNADKKEITLLIMTLQNIYEDYYKVAKSNFQIKPITDEQRTKYEKYAKTDEDIIDIMIRENAVEDMRQSVEDMGTDAFNKLFNERLEKITEAAVNLKKSRDDKFKLYEHGHTNVTYTFTVPWSDDLINVLMSQPSRLVTSTTHLDTLGKRPKGTQTIAQYVVSKDNTLDEATIDVVINSFEKLFFTTPDDTNLINKAEKNTTDEVPDALKKYISVQEYVDTYRKIGGVEKNIIEYAYASFTNKLKDSPNLVVGDVKTIEQVEDIENKINQHLLNMSIIFKNTSDVYKEKPVYKNLQEIYTGNNVSILNKHKGFMSYIKDVFNGRDFLTREIAKDLKEELGLNDIDSLSDLNDSDTVEKFITGLISHKANTNKNKKEFFALMVFINKLKNIYMFADPKKVKSYKGAISYFEENATKGAQRMMQAIDMTGMLDETSDAGFSLKENIRNDNLYIHQALARQEALNKKVGLLIVKDETTGKERHTFKPQFIVSKYTNIKLMTIQTQNDIVAPLFKDRKNVDVFGNEALEYKKDFSEGASFIMAEAVAKNYQTIASTNTLYMTLVANFSKLLFKIMPSLPEKSFVRLLYITNYMRLIKQDPGMNGYYRNIYNNYLKDNGVNKEEAAVLVAEISKIFLERKNDLNVLGKNEIEGVIGYIIDAKYSTKSYESKIDDMNVYKVNRLLAKNAQYKAYEEDVRKRIMVLMDDPTQSDEDKSLQIYELIYGSDVIKTPEEQDNLAEIRESLLNYHVQRDIHIYDTRDFIDRDKRDSVGKGGLIKQQLVHYTAVAKREINNINARYNKVKELVALLKKEGFLHATFNPTITQSRILGRNVFFIDDTSIQIIEDAYKLYGEKFKTEHDAAENIFNTYKTPEALKLLAQEVQQAETNYIKALVEASPEIKKEILSKRKEILKRVESELQTLEGKQRDAVETKAKKKRFSTYSSAPITENWSYSRAKIEADPAGIYIYFDDVESANEGKITDTNLHGLTNAVSIYTKKSVHEHFKDTDADYKIFTERVNEVFENLPVNGKRVYIPKGGLISAEARSAGVFANKDNRFEKFLNEKIALYNENAKLSEPGTYGQLKYMLYNKFYNAREPYLYILELLRTLKEKAKNKKLELKQVLDTHDNPDEVKMILSILDDDDDITFKTAYNNLNKLLTNVYLDYGYITYKQGENDRVYFMDVGSVHRSNNAFALNKKNEYVIFEQELFETRKKLKKYREKISDVDYEVDDELKEALSLYIRSFDNNVDEQDKKYHNQLFNSVNNIKETFTTFDRPKKETLNRLPKELVALYAVANTWMRYNKKNRALNKTYEVNKAESDMKKLGEKIKTVEELQTNVFKNYGDLKEQLNRTIATKDAYIEDIRKNNEIRRTQVVPYGASNIGVFKKLYNYKANDEAINGLITMHAMKFSKSAGKTQEEAEAILREEILKYGDLDIHNPVVDILITYSNMLHYSPENKNMIGLDIETFEDDSLQSVPYQITLLTPNEDGTFNLSTVFYNSYVFFDIDNSGKYATTDGRGPLLEKFYQQQKLLWNNNYIKQQEDDGVANPVELTKEEIDKKFNALIDRLQGTPSSMAEVNAMIALISGSNKTVFTHNGKEYDRAIYEKFTKTFTKKFLLNLLDHKLKEETPENVLRRAGITDVNASNIDQARQVLEASYRKIIKDIQAGKYNSAQQIDILTRHVEATIKYLIKAEVIQNITRVENETGYYLNEQVRNEVLDENSGIIAELKNELYAALASRDRKNIYGLFERGIRDADNTPENILELRKVVDTFIDAVFEQYDKLINDETILDKEGKRGTRADIIKHYTDILDAHIKATTGIDPNDKATYKGQIKSHDSFLEQMRDRMNMVEKSLSQEDIDEVEKKYKDELEAAKEEARILEEEIIKLQNDLGILESGGDLTVSKINEIGANLNNLLFRLVEKNKKMINTKGKEATKNYVSGFLYNNLEINNATKNTIIKKLVSMIKLFTIVVEEFKKDPTKVFDTSIITKGNTKGMSPAEIKSLEDAIKLLESYDNAASMKPSTENLNKLLSALALVKQTQIIKNPKIDTSLEKYLKKFIKDRLVPQMEDILTENLAKIKDAFDFLGLKHNDITLDIKKYEILRERLISVKDPALKNSDAYRTAVELLHSKSSFVEIWQSYSRYKKGLFDVVEILSNTDIREALITLIRNQIIVEKNTAELLDKIKNKNLDVRSLNKEYLFNLYKNITMQILSEEEVTKDYNTKNIFSIINKRTVAPKNYEELRAIASQTIDDKKLKKANATSRIYIKPYENSDKIIFVPSKDNVYSDVEANANSGTFLIYDDFNDSSFYITAKTIVLDDAGNTDVVFSLEGDYNYRTVNRRFDKIPNKKKLKVTGTDKSIAEWEEKIKNFYSTGKDGIGLHIGKENTYLDDNVDHSFNAFVKAFETLKEFKKTKDFFSKGAYKKLTVPITDIGKRGTLTAVNVTARAEKLFIDRVKVLEKTKGDYGDNQISGEAYQAIYNDIMKKWDLVPGNTFSVEIPPEYSKGNTLQIDQETIAKEHLDILSVTESNANLKYRGHNALTYEPLFKHSVNSMRTMLSSLQFYYNFTSIKVINELYEIEDKRNQRNSNLAVLLESAEDIDKQIKNTPNLDGDELYELNLKRERNKLLIREYQKDGVTKRENVFTPNIVSKKMYNAYQDDVFHKVGINLTVGFLDLGPAFEDTMAIDADVCRQLWSASDKTWLEDGGFKGAVRPIEGLKAKFGVDIIASKSSVVNRGSEILWLKQAFNVIREYMLTGKTDNAKVKELLDNNIKAIRAMIGEENIVDDKIILDPHVDYAYKLDKILGRHFTALIESDDSVGKTITFTDPDNGTYTDTIKDNIYKGTLYVILDSSHRSESAAHASDAIKDEKLYAPTLDSTDNVKHGFLLSLTVRKPLEQMIGSDNLKKLFPNEDLKTAEYTKVRFNGIKVLFKIIYKNEEKKEVDYNATLLEINKIKAKKLRDLALQYLDTLTNKHKSEAHKKTELININEASKKEAAKAISGSTHSTHFSAGVKRYPGIRQSVLANTDLLLGTVLTSENGMRNLFQQNRDNDWLKEEDITDDVEWRKLIAYKNIKVKNDVVSTNNKYEMMDFIEHLNSKGIHNIGGNEIYYLSKDGRKLTFKKHAIKYGYVLMMRSPVQNVRAVPVVKVVGFTSHSALEVSPYLYGMMGMDNDGDAVNMTGIKYHDVEDENGAARALDATKKEYYKSGYLNKVFEDLKNKKVTPKGSGIEYNWRGKLSYNKIMRPNANVTFSEILKDTASDAFENIFNPNFKSLSISKETRDEINKELERFDINNLSDEEFLLYFDVFAYETMKGEIKYNQIFSERPYINSEGNWAFRGIDTGVKTPDRTEHQKDSYGNIIAVGIKAFDETTDSYKIVFTNGETFTYKKKTNVEHIKELFDEKAYIDIIKKHYVFNKLFEKHERVWSDFIMPTREMFEQNQNTLEDYAVPALDPYTHVVNKFREGDKWAKTYIEKVIINSIFNRQALNTVLRIGTVKLLIGQTGGARKPRYLNSFTIENEKITKDDNFYRNVFAAAEMIYVPNKTRLKELFSAIFDKDGKIINSYILNNYNDSGTRNSVYDYLKNLWDMVERQTVSKEELNKLTAFFMTSTPDLSLRNVQKLLRNSSIEHELYVTELLKITENLDAPVSKDILETILSLYFGPDIRTINRFLKFEPFRYDSDGKVIGFDFETARSPLNMYIFGTDEANYLDGLIQIPISLAKHGATTINYAFKKNIMDNDVNNNVTSRATTTMRPFVGSPHDMFKAYAAEKDTSDVIRMTNLKEDTEEETVSRNITDIILKDQNSKNGYKTEMLYAIDSAVSFTLFGNVKLEDTKQATEFVLKQIQKLNAILKRGILNKEDYKNIALIFVQLNKLGVSLNSLRKAMLVAQYILFDASNKMLSKFSKESPFTVNDVRWLRDNSAFISFVDKMRVNEAKNKFIKNANNAVITNYIFGKFEDEDMAIYIDENTGEWTRTKTNKEYKETTARQDMTLLEELLGEDLVKKLLYEQREVSSEILNKLNLITAVNNKTVDEMFHSLKEDIILLFKFIEKFDEDIKKDTKIKSSEQIIIDLINRYVLNGVKLEQYFNLLTQQYANAVKNKKDITEIAAKLEIIKDRIYILTNTISVLRDKIENQKSIGTKASVMDALQRDYDALAKKGKEQKERLMVRAIYQNIGGLITLLRTKNNLSIYDATNNEKPKVAVKTRLSQEDVTSLLESNILQMDSYQIPFLVQASYFTVNGKFNAKQMYAWLKDSNFVATQIRYAYDYETLERKIIDQIRIIKNEEIIQFKNIKELKEYLKQFAINKDPDVKILLNNEKLFDDFDPLIFTEHDKIPDEYTGTKEKVNDLSEITTPQADVLYIVDNKFYLWNGTKFVEQLGIEQHITPTLKQILINGPEDLQKIYDKINEQISDEHFQDQYLYGFTTRDDMMNAMEQSYKFFTLEGKYKNFVKKLQQAQKLAMRLSIGFLFRNATDTVHQLLSELIYERGLGGTILNTREILKYTGMSLEVYSVYKQMSESRLYTLYEIKTDYENVKKLLDKPTRSEEEEGYVSELLARIKTRLESYVQIGSVLIKTEKSTALHKNLKYAKTLLENFNIAYKKYSENSALKTALNRTLENTVTFLGNITFAEYFLMYDNFKVDDNTIVAGLRFDPYEIIDGKRVLKTEQTMAEKYSNNSFFMKRNKLYYDDFKEVLFDISAFMNTNAQVDLYKQEQYTDLQKAINLMKSRKDTGKLKTYEEIKLEIELSREHEKSKLIKLKENTFDFVYTNANEHIENSARITAYLYDKFINKYGHEEIIQRSLNRWFNYGQRSAIEVQLLADIPYLSFPLRSIKNWINRLFNPSYMRFLSDVMDGVYSQFADDDGVYDKFMLYQMQNGWVPITKTWGIRFGNGAFDVQNILSNTPDVIKQRTNPILNGVRKLLETHDVSEALKALATTGVITRVMNTVTALTGTREAAQNTPILNNFVSQKPASTGTSLSFLYDYKEYEKYTPKRYIYSNNGRYAKYENIYRDWFNKYGRMRRPKVDVLSLVKDIQWKQYVRWRRQQLR